MSVVRIDDHVHPEAVYEKDVRNDFDVRPKDTVLVLMSTAQHLGAKRKPRAGASMSGAISFKNGIKLIRKVLDGYLGTGHEKKKISMQASDQLR